MDGEFGAWLQGEMDERDLNVVGLGKKIGRAHSSILAWIDGSSRPSPASIRKLAAVLGVPLTEIHVALGDIPPLTGLTEEQQRVVTLLLEADDPRVYRAVEALLLSLRDEE